MSVTPSKPLPAQAPDPLIGTRINDRYLVERVHVRGGMSVIYAALHEQQQREVAIKVLDEAFVDDFDAVERFIHEARLASSLSHGHVVGVSDSGSLPDGRPYLVMPMIAGTDLATQLGEEGPMTPQRVAVLLEGVASALDALHAEGLVHRDIKSENLMYIRGDDGKETALLLDFGIAAADPLVQQVWLEPSGTPEFMAPEVLAGGASEPASDVYALATVAFELITGNLPFECEDLPALLREKAKGPPPTLSQVSGQRFPQALEDVLARGLAREQWKRQRSAAQLVRELAAAAAQMPAPDAKSASERRVPRPRTLVGPFIAPRSAPAQTQAPGGKRRPTQPVWQTKRRVHAQAASSSSRSRAGAPKAEGARAGSAATKRQTTSRRASGTSPASRPAAAKPQPARKGARAPKPALPAWKLDAAALKSPLGGAAAGGPRPWTGEEAAPGAGSGVTELAAPAPTEALPPQNAASIAAGESAPGDARAQAQDPLSERTQPTPASALATGDLMAPGLDEDTLRPPLEVERASDAGAVPRWRALSRLALAALAAVAVIAFVALRRSPPAPAAMPKRSAATATEPQPAVGPAKQIAPPAAQAPRAVEPQSATPAASADSVRAQQAEPEPEHATEAGDEAEHETARSAADTVSRRTQAGSARSEHAHGTRAAREREAPRADKRAAGRARAAELARQATDAMLRGDFEAATTQYKQAIAADRSYAPAYRGQGLVLERLGRTHDAARAFRKFLRLRPDDRGADKIRARLQALEAR